MAKPSSIYSAGTRVLVPALPITDDELWKLVEARAAMMSAHFDRFTLPTFGAVVSKRYPGVTLGHPGLSDSWEQWKGAQGIFCTGDTVATVDGVTTTNFWGFHRSNKAWYSYVLLTGRTEGLDDEPCHIIQISGKHWGSSAKNAITDANSSPRSALYHMEDELAGWSQALQERKGIVDKLEATVWLENTLLGICNPEWRQR